MRTHAPLRPGSCCAAGWMELCSCAIHFVAKWLCVVTTTCGLVAQMCLPACSAAGADAPSCPPAPATAGHALHRRLFRARSSSPCSRSAVSRRALSACAWTSASPMGSVHLLQQQVAGLLELGRARLRCFLAVGIAGAPVAIACLPVLLGFRFSHKPGADGQPHIGPRDLSVEARCRHVDSRACAVRACVKARATKQGWPAIF